MKTYTTRNRLMNDHTELAKMDFEYFFDLIITAAASVFYFTSYIYPTG